MSTQYLVFIFACISSCFFANAFPNDDISIIRNRVLNLTIWPKPESIPSITKLAIEYAETLNNSCYWPDINYADKSIVVWHTATHMYRITTMLQAFSVNGSTVKNDTNLLSAIHCAINTWLIHDWQNPNWWFNQINIPQEATRQLLMLGNNATSFEVEHISKISYRAAWWLGRSQDVGANLADMILVQLCRSLATVNLTGIEQGFARVWQDVMVQRVGDEGVQNDWSYHFHGQQILSGSYGLVWANDILLFALCSQNTKYAMSPQQLITFVEFLTKGDAWMIINRQWDWHVVGRGISGVSNGFNNGFQTDWIKLLVEFIQSNNTKLELMNFVNMLDGESNASMTLGNKHFYTSDYQVHRRVNWTATIKIQSIRTQPSECINGQNLKDEHGGQGVLNLYIAGHNDYRDIFPIIDWQAINGITVEHDIPIEPCINGKFVWQSRSFVGGVSDGEYGLAIMDTASHNLIAQRSWHFYDTAIIALATNLTLSTSNTAWTTLASRLLVSGQVTVGFFNETSIKLSDGNYSFPYSENKAFNIQWIHIEETNIGYLLQIQPSYASLGIEVGIKTGNYDTIGPFNHTITARILTIWIDHGLGPITRDYAYMIVPNVSVETMPNIIKQYDEEQVFTCVSTNNYFHGTMWPASTRASFVLWDDITAKFSCKSQMFQVIIELNNSGAYLFRETSIDFTVTVSHPIRLNSTVIVIVDRIGYGEGCTIVSNKNESMTKMTLQFPSSLQLLGASVNVTCKKTRFH